MQTSHAVVGLGNPGWRYRNTRHNIGFMVIDRLVRRAREHSRVKTSCALHTFAEFDGAPPLLLSKPMTFMNRSGEAVSEIVAKFGIPIDHLLVAVDDFNLPFGKLRFRSKGSAGGHNGLKSIIAHLGNEAFPRLRIGIGQEHVDDAVRFVLGRFSRQERANLEHVIEQAADACLFFAAHGITRSMNQYN